MVKSVDKSLNRLSTATLRAALAGTLDAKSPWLADGGGLYLKVGTTGASWVFRYSLGKPRMMGLGSLADVGASAARELARGHRATLAEGRDPMLARAKVRADEQAQVRSARGKATTFRKIGDIVLDEIDKSGLHARTCSGWRQSVVDYAYPVLGDLALDEIEHAQILEVLKPIWGAKPQTGRNVRQRIERIFDEAKVLGMTSRPNPARFADLKRSLSKYVSTKPKSEGHIALPWQDVPAFYRRVKAQDGYAPRALMLTILAAVRSAEALGAQFDEFKDGLWTIPAERMKGKPGERRKHRVPVSTAIAEIVEELDLVRRGPFLFPGRYDKSVCQSETVMRRLLSALGMDGKATVHGFRSSFRDWARDNGLNREAAEASLAHVVGGVEGHYARSDMLDERRELMARWADFVTGRVASAKAKPGLKLVA